MVLLTSLSTVQGIQALPSSFRSWQREALAAGTLPLIGVAGSRGKSTVVRLLDVIFTRAGLRTATWTDGGVEIRGRRQRSELGGWTRALGHLPDGSVDVAVQELDWATVNAVGLPVATYPVVAITNLCGNNEACLTDPQTRYALRAIPTVMRAVRHDGLLVLNGDDYHLAADRHQTQAETLLTGISGDSPLISSRLATGRPCLWIEEDTVVVGHRSADATQVVNLADVPLTLAGEATFEVFNLLTSVGIAFACGLDLGTIRAGVSGFEALPSILPGSFNVHDINGSRAIVDRIGPPWSLRPILRAANPGGRANQMTVIGALDKLPTEDVYELGRLLGRYRGAVILHSTQSQVHLEEFRRGLTLGRVPPLMVRLPTERRALNRAVKMLSAGNPLLVFTDDPDPVNRTFQRLV